MSRRLSGLQTCLDQMKSLVFNLLFFVCIFKKSLPYGSNMTPKRIELIAYYLNNQKKRTTSFFPMIQAKILSKALVALAWVTCPTVYQSLW